jgi:very-short-patch-repair endonuclease
VGGDMSDLRDKARDLRKNMTDAERRLWSHLRNEQLGVRFRRQAPIGPYIADFACFSPRIVIEVDGGQHDEQQGYDTRRDEWLRSQGFVVLRFWNNEMLGNTEGVLERILSELKVLSASTPHPNPPPKWRREEKAAASLEPAPSPWMGEGWGRGAAQQVTREAGGNPTPHPNPPPQGGRVQADSTNDPRGES